jgi:hypothetical protein
MSHIRNSGRLVACPTGALINGAEAPIPYLRETNIWRNEIAKRAIGPTLTASQNSF